jgi:hypothetical protein
MTLPTPMSSAIIRAARVDHLSLPLLPDEHWERPRPRLFQVDAASARVRRPHAATSMRRHESTSPSVASRTTPAGHWESVPRGPSLPPPCSGQKGVVACRALRTEF